VRDEDAAPRRVVEVEVERASSPLARPRVPRVAGELVDVPVARPVRAAGRSSRARASAAPRVERADPPPIGSTACPAGLVQAKAEIRPSSRRTKACASAALSNGPTRRRLLERIGAA